MHLSEFRLDVSDVLLYLVNIDEFFLFKCIDVTRDVEVIVIILDFLERSNVAVFRLVLIMYIRLVLNVSIYNLLDVALAENVLVLALFIVTIATCIYEKNFIICSTILAEDKDTCGDTCALEEVCRKTYYRIKKVEALNNCSANFSFTCATEEYTVRKDDAHTSCGIVKAVKHMHNERIVSL